MDTSSAPSLLAEQISDMALNDVLFVSVIFVVILLAVLLAFGIKIYLHQRHSQKNAVDETEAETPVAPAYSTNRVAPVRAAAAARENSAMPMGLRNSESAMSKFENGK